VALGQEIMTRWSQGKWDGDHAVVTTLIDSEATTVITSTSSGATISLAAKSSSVPQIDLTDASIALAIKSARNVGLQVVAAQGLAPLMGLAKIQRKHWWSPGHAWGPSAYLVASVDAHRDESVANGDTLSDVFYFGDLRGRVARAESLREVVAKPKPSARRKPAAGRAQSRKKN
jgi:hypothetical protein